MRVYKPKSGTRTYRVHDPEKIKQIIEEAKAKSWSLKKISKAHGISSNILYRFVRANGVVKNVGGQRALSMEQEAKITDKLKEAIECGFPVTHSSLKVFIKDYLDERNMVANRFNNNLPGGDFINSFIKRHKDVLSSAMDSKRSRFRANQNTANGSFRSQSEDVTVREASAILDGAAILDLKERGSIENGEVDIEVEPPEVITSDDIINETCDSKTATIPHVAKTIDCPNGKKLTELITPDSIKLNANVHEEDSCVNDIMDCNTSDQGVLFPRKLFPAKPKKKKKNMGIRRYRRYSTDHISKILTEIESSNLTFRKAAKKYDIPASLLSRYARGCRHRPPGGQRIFSDEEEKHIVDKILEAGKWGCPITFFTIKVLVKDHLDQQQRVVTKFKGNQPGEAFLTSFVDRHRGRLSLINAKRIGQDTLMEILSKYFAFKDQEQLNGNTDDFRPGVLNK